MSRALPGCQTKTTYASIQCRVDFVGAYAECSKGFLCSLEGLLPRHASEPEYSRTTSAAVSAPTTS
jgi:hypothetical protein